MGEEDWRIDPSMFEKAPASDVEEIARLRQQLAWAYGEIDKLTGATIPSLQTRIGELEAENDGIRRHMAQAGHYVRACENRAEAAESSLASERAENARLREALTIVRPILISLIAADYNVETWGLAGRLVKVQAALSAPAQPVSNSDKFDDPTATGG